MRIKCVIIDDEPIARKGIEKYVEKIDFLELVATCGSANELNNIIIETPVDLIFLDIEMSGISGLDYLKTLKNPPLVIITTAYRKYAFEGYELDVLDYLLKPITNERFLKAVNKAHAYFLLTHEEGKPQKDYFFVKCDKKLEKIIITDILYIQSMQNYIVIYTDDNKYTTLYTMKKIKEFLSDEIFVQIHNSYIVAISKIDAIDGNQVVIGVDKLPISRSLKDEVLMSIVNTRLLNKK